MTVRIHSVLTVMARRFCIPGAGQFSSFVFSRIPGTKYNRIESDPLLGTMVRPGGQVPYLPTSLVVVGTSGAYRYNGTLKWKKSCA